MNYRPYRSKVWVIRNFAYDHNTDRDTESMWMAANIKGHLAIHRDPEFDCSSFAYASYYDENPKYNITPEYAGIRVTQGSEEEMFELREHLLEEYDNWEVFTIEVVKEKGPIYQRELKIVEEILRRHDAWF